MPRKHNRTNMIPNSELSVRYERTFPADVASLESIVKEIMRLISQFQCAVKREFEVELALREALANAVIHGCGADSTKEVAVTVACAESIGVLIVVRDPGRGFDPANVPSPVAGENIYSNHGRGIFLINNLMDEVRFEKGGTEIHMLKRVKP